MISVSRLEDTAGLADAVAFAELAVLVQVLEVVCIEGADSHFVADSAG